MLKGVFAATLLVLSTSLVSGFVTTPGLDFTHCPREGVLRHGSRVLSPRMEAPKLGQVRLPACKKLCPGCEPWICPLAPQGEDANEPHSESAARLLELREEQELNRDKERLEALAAGVIGVESLEQWEKLIAENNADGHVSVVFWGGSWCRKCMALKPKYVKLAGEMTKEATEGTLRFYYADARGVAQKVGNSRAPPPYCYTYPCPYCTLTPPLLPASCPASSTPPFPSYSSPYHSPYCTLPPPPLSQPR
jgi:thiol-disulfide isomerase/thioredoxin